MSHKNYYADYWLLCNLSHVVHSSINNVSKIVRPWVYTCITVFEHNVVRSGLSEQTRVGFRLGLATLIARDPDLSFGQTILHSVDCLLIQIMTQCI